MLHQSSYVISIKAETNWCPLTFINRTIDLYHALIGHFRVLCQIPRVRLIGHWQLILDEMDAEPIMKS